ARNSCICSHWPRTVGKRSGHALQTSSGVVRESASWSRSSWTRGSSLMFRTFRRRAPSFRPDELGTLPKYTDILPESATFLSLFGIQFFERRGIAEAGKIGISFPARQGAAYVCAIGDRVTVDDLVPRGQIRAQPLPCLTAPSLAVRFPELWCIFAVAAAGAGGGAGSVVAMAGVEVLGQGRGGCKRIRIEVGHRAGAVLELAGAEKSKALVVVLRPVLPVHARRRVRQDEPLGLATQR